MIPKLTMLFAAVAILGGLAATTVLAQENTPPAQPPQAHGMVGEHGGMMGMMGQMMSPDHMKQMARMLENCNRMMEAMSRAPMGPDKEPAPGHDG